MLKEKDLLKVIWGFTQEWDTLYHGWKQTRVVLTGTTAMGASAFEFTKKLHKLGKDPTAKSWGCRIDLDQRVKDFKNTMPLIEGLKDSAMRPRHWSNLKVQSLSISISTPHHYHHPPPFCFACHNCLPFSLN